MPIRYIADGDIFQSTCTHLVCPVNCVGVMGKGLALEFKRKYPTDFYRTYVDWCTGRRIFPGSAGAIWTDAYCEVPGLFKPVILFATKDDWRDPSKLSRIQTGLYDLFKVIEAHHIESVALPAVGCGKNTGQLRWPEVRTEIEYYLHDSSAQIDVYLPK